jgi:hypothetical protein
MFGFGRGLLPLPPPRPFRKHWREYVLSGAIIFGFIAACFLIEKFFGWPPELPFNNWHKADLD